MRVMPRACTSAFEMRIFVVFNADEDTGAGLPWSECNTDLAPAGAAAVGGGWVVKLNGVCTEYWAE